LIICSYESYIRMHLSSVADALDGVDCILNCDSTSKLPSNFLEDSYLELPVVVGDTFLGPFVFSLHVRFCYDHTPNACRAQRMTVSH
jgi:hypothetical protein